MRGVPPFDARQARSLSQRRALGTTSFSAVCVGEKRATLVYVRPSDFAAAKTAVSGRPPLPLGWTTHTAPSRAIAAHRGTEPREIEGALGAEKDHIAVRREPPDDDAGRPRAQLGDEGAVVEMNNGHGMSGLHVELVDERAWMADTLGPPRGGRAEREGGVAAVPPDAEIVVDDGRLADRGERDGEARPLRPRCACRCRRRVAAKKELVGLEQRLAVVRRASEARATACFSSHSPMDP